jgi:high-affinity iron transporter
MLSTALIVFREVLEAALVVSIVMAATKGVPRRGWWVGGGLVGGVIGAGLIAAFADAISQWASGMGQEVFNAGVMFVATLMLAWHCIWMSRHGREIALQMGEVGRAVAGRQPAADGARDRGRRGGAARRLGGVLFLYGIAAGDPGQTPQMIAGGLLGVLGGAGLGYAMYAGLLQIPLKRLFSVTNVLIVLLAAGMASQCVGFLLAAGLVPSWGDAVGHVVAAEGIERRRQGAACADRLYRASGRHPDRRVRRDAGRDRRAGTARRPAAAGRAAAARRGLNFRYPHATRGVVDAPCCMRPSCGPFTDDRRSTRGPIRGRLRALRLRYRTRRARPTLRRAGCSA